MEDSLYTDSQANIFFLPFLNAIIEDNLKMCGIYCRWCFIEITSTFQESGTSKETFLRIGLQIQTETDELTKNRKYSLSISQSDVNP